MPTTSDVRLGEVFAARVARDAAVTRYETAVAAARHEGVTLRAVGAIAGLSHTGVAKVARRVATRRGGAQ